MSERGVRHFVVTAMTSPFALPVMGGSLLAAVALGIHLGESSIGQINPIYFQGPAVHPRDAALQLTSQPAAAGAPAYPRSLWLGRGRRGARPMHDCGRRTRRPRSIGRSLFRQSRVAVGPSARRARAWRGLPKPDHSGPARGPAAYYPITRRKPRFPHRPTRMRSAQAEDDRVGPASRPAPGCRTVGAAGRARMHDRRGLP
jgi:hypothetical protein